MSYYDFSWLPDISGGEVGLFSVAIVTYLVVLLLASGYSLLVYILQSLGLYTIANRRGIHHPWLAWIPIGTMWTLGSISDQYQYVAKGQVKNRRKILIGLAIAVFVLCIVLAVVMTALLIQTIQMEAYGMNEGTLITSAAILCGVYLLMMVLAIISAVFQYICLYNLYASCNPDNAVAFLILGIFFNFLTPFFIFACRKKDLGMPPRRTQYAPAPAWQPAPQIPAQPLVQPSAPAEPVTEIPDPTPVADVPADEPAEGSIIPEPAQEQDTEE